MFINLANYGLMRILLLYRSFTGNTMMFIRFFIWLFIALASTASAQSNLIDFVKDKTLHQGFFSFYHDNKEGRIYLEIDKFNAQFLFQSSLPQGIGSNDIGLDRGQLGDTRLVQFEQVGNKVFLRQFNPYYRADSHNTMEKQAVEQAFASSIIWGFKVVARSEISNKTHNNEQILIDYTPFLLSDIHNIGETLKKK
jgi:hypothetical protein